MNPAKPVKYNNSIIAILWGLIFSKCFILEYLVQIYSVPINSTIYVWLLTLWMALIATFVFFRLNSVKADVAKVPLWMFVNWIGCGAIPLLVIALAFNSTLITIDPYSAPALIAFFLGIGYLIHGITGNKSSYTLRGICWWAAAAILFIQNNVNSLLLFALSILLLSVFPVILEMRKQRLAFNRMSETEKA